MCRHEHVVFLVDERKIHSTHSILTLQKLPGAHGEGHKHPKNGSETYLKTFQISIYGLCLPTSIFSVDSTNNAKWICHVVCAGSIANNAKWIYHTSHRTTPHHSAAQHSRAQRSTTENNTAQHGTVQHSTAQHSTAGVGG